MTLSLPTSSQRTVGPTFKDIPILERYFPGCPLHLRPCTLISDLPSSNGLLAGSLPSALATYLCVLKAAGERSLKNVKLMFSSFMFSNGFLVTYGINPVSCPWPIRTSTPNLMVFSIPLAFFSYFLTFAHSSDTTGHLPIPQAHKDMRAKGRGNVRSSRKNLPKTRREKESWDEKFLRR